MPAARRFSLALLTFSLPVIAQTYSAPAGIRPALRGPVGTSASSILPGGRVITPLGEQHATGSGPFGLVVSASGKTVVTSDGGPGRSSLTVMERGTGAAWDVRHLVARSLDSLDQFDARDWRSVFMGLALSGEHAVFASEGNSGRISLFDWSSQRRRVIDLNQGGFDDSYTGDLALDAERNVLYAVDQANSRVAVIDARSRQVLASVRVGRLPFALALSPDRRKLYVTNVGMFEYRAIPGANPQKARATGLPFPPFGFPSSEAAAGVERQTAHGPVMVPGLGDPNAPESNSVCVVDVSTPAAPKVETFIRTGIPLGEQSLGGSSPSGIVATASQVFVSNANDDSITVIDAAANRVEAEIPIRIVGLETLRGVLPIGMAYHEKSGWLLVAEAGINAVGIVDTRQRQVIGHLPAGWFPTRVAIDRDTVFVANSKGNGVGPNAYLWAAFGGVLPNDLRQGSIAVFPLPRVDELAAHTAFVIQANGFFPHADAPRALPDGIRHVVLIVKEGRAYDEVFGDIRETSNGRAMGTPQLARFGSRGYLDGQGKRLSIRDLQVTPNHHAIARQWSFSDNFYADSDVGVGGHHWLVGSYPNAWTESSLLAAYSEKKDFRLGAAPGRLLFAGSASSVHPEEQLQAGTIWHHFARHGVSFYNFGEGFDLAGVNEAGGLEPTGARFLTNVPLPEPLYRNTSRQYPGFNMNIPDQYRASQFIHEIAEKYVATGSDLPQFLFVYLPNDHMADARPEQGYPYRESFVADNDLALGRILEYLSGTKWWNQMAVFVTEADAEGGVDHIDAHRTVLLGAGPWFKKNYVSHTHTSFPGLLKTIFRLLHVPPLNLYDQTASDLSDCFALRPDAAGYKALPEDQRIFDPDAAAASRSGEPSPRMEDPREVRR